MANTNDFEKYVLKDVWTLTTSVNQAGFFLPFTSSILITPFGKQCLNRSASFPSIGFRSLISGNSL